MSHLPDDVQSDSEACACSYLTERFPYAMERAGQINIPEEIPPGGEFRRRRRALRPGDMLLGIVLVPDARQKGAQQACDKLQFNGYTAPSAG